MKLSGLYNKIIKALGIALVTMLFITIGLAFIYLAFYILLLCLGFILSAKTPLLGLIRLICGVGVVSFVLNICGSFIKK